MTDIVSFALVFAVLFAVAFPLLTLLHELAHALGCRAFSRTPVDIWLGMSPSWQAEPNGASSESPFVVRPGWLTLTVSRYWFQRPHLGWIRWLPDAAGRGPSRRAWIASTAAGPLVSLLLAALFAWATLAGDFLPEPVRAILLWSAVYAALQTLMTAIPFTYPSFWSGYAGHPSDGVRLRQILQERDEPSAASSR